MLGKILGRTLLILGLVACLLPAYADGGNYQLSVDGGSHLWVDGTSTLHKWGSTTSSFILTTGTATMATATIPDTATLTTQIVGVFVLKIPVQTLKDPDEPALDGNLWNDLKYKQYPDIVFTLSACTATPDPSVAGRYEVVAQGTLSIAGKENPESLHAIVDVNGNTVRITGTEDLLMTDFGIKPPTMFFGTIKTGDKITIRWDLSLSEK